MKKIIAIVCIIICVFSVIACEDSGVNNSIDPPISAATIEPEITTSPVQYDIKFNEWTFIKNWEDKNSIVLSMTWTNTTNETKGFDTACSVMAYQNGIELERSFLSIGNESNWHTLEDNKDLSIRPGTTLEVAVTFIVRDNTSPIEIEVKDWISFDNTIHASTTIPLT